MSLGVPGITLDYAEFSSSAAYFPSRSAASVATGQLQQVSVEKMGSAADGNGVMVVFSAPQKEIFRRFEEGGLVLLNKANNEIWRKLLLMC